MEGESLQELVKKQAMLIEQQAEIIKRQEAEIAGLRAQIVELQTTIAPLHKDSRNSTKPPSSDLVKPKTKEAQETGGKNRKIGGQKGHKKHERAPFPPKQVDTTIEVTLDKCPICGRALQESEKPAAVHQQLEIAPKPFIVTEYHRHTYWCQTYHTAPLPEEGRSGLFSISLIAFAAYLKGRCPIAFSALKDFFQETLGIAVSRGIS